MTFDDYAGPASKKDLAEVLRDAERYFHLWGGRAVLATGAFVLSCALVLPFLDGHSQHAHWESVGKNLLLLSMALFVPFVVCVVIAVSAWIQLCNLRRVR